MIYYEDCLIGEHSVLCVKVNQDETYSNYIETGVVITDAELKDHSYYQMSIGKTSMYLMSSGVPKERVNIKRLADSGDELIVPLIKEVIRLKNIEKGHQNQIKELSMDLELANNKFEHAIAYLSINVGEK